MLDDQGRVKVLDFGLRGDVEKAVLYLRESIAAMPALNRARAAADPVLADPAFTDALAVSPLR